MTSPPGPPAPPGPPVRAPESRRAVLAALAANVGIAVTKLIAFVITGSASMLAESVHSAADSGNQVLLLIGRSRSRRPRTDAHQFGYGAERYFYAFIVALVLFTVGAVFSVYEGIERMAHPERVQSAVVAFAVLGVAMVLEAASLRTALAESSRARGRRGLASFIRHAKSPELPAVLLEDLAALAGLACAFCGVGLSALTHDGRWDGAGSLAIGALLGFVAVVLAVETKSLLLGESADAASEGAIVAAIEAEPVFRHLIHLRTLHLGPETLLVAAKVAVRGADSAAVVAGAIDAAERRIRAAVPIARMIFLEPDLYQDERLDAADPAVRAARRWSAPLRAAGRTAVRAVRGGQRGEPGGIA